MANCLDAHPLIQVISDVEARAFLNNDKLCAECERLGIDLGLLVENLQVSPEARLQRHSNALNMALAFREAGARDRCE